MHFSDPWDKRYIFTYGTQMGPPVFDWKKRPSFGGLNPRNRGHLQVPGTYIYIYGGCPKFFLLETAILSQKKITLAKLSPYSQKTFADPVLDCIWEFLLGNRSLTRDICVSERPSKLILWRLRIDVSRFAFNGGPCSPSPASSDTPTPKLRAHLLPASLQTRHNKSTV